VEQEIIVDRAPARDRPPPGCSVPDVVHSEHFRVVTPRRGRRGYSLARIVNCELLHRRRRQRVVMYLHPPQRSNRDPNEPPS
jgi:hypothetical protein